MPDWAVKVYYENGTTEAWDISDRTKGEAFNEAEADVMNLDGVADWTLMRMITIGSLSFQEEHP